MKSLFSYFQQFSLPKVRKTRLQADFVTNNQILVIKIIKIRHPPAYQILWIFPTYKILRPTVYSGPKSTINHSPILSKMERNMT